MNLPRIILVEDHLLVRQLYGLVVREHLGVEPVGTVGSVGEAWAILLKTKPDLVVADWTLPDGNVGALVRECAPALPETRWLVVSSRADESILRGALALGVHGLVLKHSPLEILLEAMRKVLAGETYYCARSARVVVNSVRADARVMSDPLTLREREVLRGLVRGQNPKEIADQIGSKVKTVQNQISLLKDKLGIREPAGLIRYALRSGVLEAEEAGHFTEK